MTVQSSTVLPCLAMTHLKTSSFHLCHNEALLYTPTIFDANTKTDTYALVLKLIISTSVSFTELTSLVREINSRIDENI